MITPVMSCGLSKRGDCIELRPPDLDKLVAGHTLFCSPELVKDFLLPGDQPPTLDCYKWMVTRAGNSPGHWPWWIYVSDELAGLAGISQLEEEGDGYKYGKLYYLVAPAFQRQGVATQVVKRITQYVFREAGILKRLDVEVRSNNTVGMRFALKLGFTKGEFKPINEEEGEGEYLWCSSYP